MARWNGADWAELVSGAACPICRDGGPSDTIAALPGAWLAMSADAAPALPGTCALFARRHVVELHELTEAEAADFMQSLRIVSELLKSATGAVKINCEMHGNTIPHLHMHFFPRYRGDPFENGPIDLSKQGTEEDALRHREVRASLLDALQRRGDMIFR
jgi:diadenosine tetraphosphate (Ap4A) HIT family hydrolase